MPTDVLQLTDLHLQADPKAVLKGVCTRETLVDVLSLARERCQAGEYDFQHLVISGDLTHDERIESYQVLRELLGDWLSRCRLIPGNHDDRALMRQVFPEQLPPRDDFISFSVAAGGWQLIGLDTHVAGEVHGKLGTRQLDWLSGELATHAGRPTVLFTHHPPVRVESAWLDGLGLRDADALLDLASAFPQVRAICSGHVHQEFSTILGDLQVLTAPSTSAQFRPREDEMICDSLQPGFRTFRFLDDTFESRVDRLPEPTR
jgi:Icc protein